MATNFLSGGQDFDDMFITDQELIDRFVGSNIFACGYNNFGQLGIDSTSNKSSPVQVGSLTNWRKAAAGSYHSVLIKTDGTLWSFGRGVYGQLGIGTTITAVLTPVQIGSLTNWSQIACTQASTHAIKTDGTLWSWGYNANGQLGLGDTTNRSSPVQVGTGNNWAQISTNVFDSVLAVKTDGTLWAWGWNLAGQLGLGDSNDRSSPVQVGSLTNWKQIASGYKHSAAVKTDGTLWTWGWNANGALCNGNSIDRSSPVQVGSLTNWKQVACDKHTMAIKTDGTLWACGYGPIGQLGIGYNVVGISSPVQVGSLSNWKQIFTGFATSLAIKTDGTLWAWGINTYGQLGHGDINHRSSPVQVGTRTNWKQVTSTYHTLIINN